MSNDDSFSNIAPALDEDVPKTKDVSKQNMIDAQQMNIDDLNLNESNLVVKDEETKAEKERKKTQVNQAKVYNIDQTINNIIKKSNLPKGKKMYEAEKLHPMNLEFKDEYVDEESGQINDI